jgi:glucose/arabinose dehydrogenase
MKPLFRVTARLCAAAFGAAALAQPAAIATREHNVRIVTIAEGLEHPWAVALLPDGRKLVTERPGRMRVIDASGKLDPVPIANLPRVDPRGQGGLLDVVLHPKFAANNLVYWTYVQRDDTGFGTELARGKLSGAPGGYRMENVEVLFRLARKSGTGLHFGSRLVFDRDGMLFMTFGDRGEMNRAQDVNDHAGKIVRLTENGKPAPGGASVTPARPEIFSLGHRNVQGAVLDPKTGQLWATEHGPQGGDELNLVKRGVNYGWPIITYGVNYVIGTKIGEGIEKEGLAQPVKYWVPSPALSGLAIYDGDKFPKWRGQLLAGALRGQALIRVTLDGEKFVEDEFMLRGQVGRVRDVRVGADGFVYLVIDAANGSLLRLEPVT